MNNLSTTFQIPKDLLYKERGLGLQGKDLSYKEKTWATRKRLVLQEKDLGYKEKTCSTRKRLGLQGNLGYKERRQDLTTIKAPTPLHIKVRISTVGRFARREGRCKEIESPSVTIRADQGRLV